MNDEILGVIKALYNHREVIRNSCVNNGGKITPLPEHEAAIRALKKHRLIWQMGDSEEITLIRPLLTLLSGAQHNRRRRLASGNVSALWSYLQERVEDYHDAFIRNKTGDLEHISVEITDALYDLANEISTSIRAFSEYIDHGYAYTRDLELRVRENERAIQKAQQLNDYLQGLNVYELVNGSRMSPSLRTLFLNHFATALSESRAELINTLHRLSDLLVKLRSDSNLGKLIRTFELKYKRDPGFVPTVPIIVNTIPEVVNHAKPFIKASRTQEINSSLDPVIGDILNLLQFDGHFY